MLDVVDGEAERLVSLEEAVEDLGTDHPDPSAGAAGSELAVEVVVGERGLERVQHLAKSFGALVGYGTMLEVEMAGDASQASARFLGGEHQFAVAAVLGWVECHGRSVY